MIKLEKVNVSEKDIINELNNNSLIDIEVAEKINEHLKAKASRIRAKNIEDKEFCVSKPQDIIDTHFAELSYKNIKSNKELYCSIVKVGKYYIEECSNNVTKIYVISRKKKCLRRKL